MQNSVPPNPAASPAAVRAFWVSLAAFIEAEKSEAVRKAVVNVMDRFGEILSDEQVADLRTALGGSWHRGTQAQIDAAKRIEEVAARGSRGIPDMRTALKMRFPALTPRQLLVAEMMVDGLGDREIAQKLGVSWNTVRNHVNAIYERTGIHSRRLLKAEL